MKGYRFFIGVLIAASVRFSGVAWGDTLDLVGGTAFDWGIGWMVGAEAWADTGWCGDTLGFDTLVGTDTTIISPILLECFEIDYLPDTGGLTPGATYINWYYRFRNYYSQLPVVWGNWSGFDATGYKYLMVVYKGLLPVHQMRLSFFYGYTFDSTKNEENHGDGVGKLTASPDEWKTAVLEIPDSVDMEGITGVTFAIENAPGKGDSTSAVGNLKVDRIALIAQELGIKHPSNRNRAANNRFYFTPSSGSVVLTAYTLQGKALTNKSVKVQSGKQYSVRRFVRDNTYGSAAQVRLIAIEGEGVHLITRMR